MSRTIVFGLVLLAAAAIAEYAVAPAGGPGFRYLAVLLLLGAVGVFIGAGVVDTA